MGGCLQLSGMGGEGLGDEMPKTEPCGLGFR
jgi:hypothetical protein